MAEPPQTPDADGDPEPAPGRPDRELDHAPGNPGWVRNFTETNSAQREPLAEGAERLPSLGPTYWTGDAEDGFTTVRDYWVRQWNDALDIHDAVIARVDGYNNFVHELPHLWEAYRGDPDELRRLSDLQATAAAELARELETHAALLDDVAVERSSTPEPVVAEPERFSEDVMSAGGYVGGDAVLVPDGQDAPTTLANRLQHSERLNEQLLSGVRTHRVPWEGMPIPPWWPRRTTARE